MKSSTGRLRWLAASAVGALLLWLAFRSVEWAGVGDAVSGSGRAGLVLAVLLNLVILLLWSLQWRLLAGRVRGRIFPVVAVMSTVSNSVPFLAGQATGVHLLATRGGVGHARALSVLAADQLAEGLAKVALLAVLATLAPLPPALASAAATLAVGVGLLAVALVVTSRLRDGADGSGGRVRRFVGRFAEGLRALRSPRLAAGALGLALAMKAAEAGAIVAVQGALGVDVPLWGTLLVLASVGLATMVAVAPGNVGAYEAAAFAAYRVVGVDAEAAAALALLQHAAFLIPAAGTGWLVLTLSGRRRDEGPVAAVGREPRPVEAGAD